MTQAVRSVLEALQHCVQWSQHLCILREAWETGIRRLKATKEEWRIPDYQDQMLRSPGLPPLSPLNTTPMGSTVGGCWPVHMILWIPTRAPAMWRLLVSSRLVPTLGPPGLTDPIGFQRACVSTAGCRRLLRPTPVRGQSVYIPVVAAGLYLDGPFTGRVPTSPAGTVTGGVLPDAAGGVPTTLARSSSIPQQGQQQQ